jgi:hypothetical protein
MALRPQTPKGAAPSIRAGEEIDLTPEQNYRVRVMGQEELDLLRSAASPGGLQLASLNWILASLGSSSGNSKKSRLLPRQVQLLHSMQPTDARRSGQSR